MVEFTLNRITRENKSLINLILVVLCLLFLPGSVSAEEAAESVSARGYAGRTIKVQHLDFEQGLSNNNVWSVWQDSLGYMWFGTVGGLNRYDGYNFVTFKNIPGDDTSISGNLITVVYEDQQGYLWVGTWEDGLNRIDRETDTITHYMYDLVDSTSIGNDLIRAIYQDSEGVLWVGTAGGGLNRYDPETDSFVRYLHDAADPNSIGSNQVFALYEDSAGDLWVGTYAGGLNRYDREIDGFWRYFTEPDSDVNLSGALIDALVEDLDGNLWLGTWGGGLFCLDLETEQVAAYSQDPEDETSLSSDYVLSLAVSNDGILWVGTDGGGLNILRPNDTTFRHFSHHAGDEQSLSNNVVRSLYVDREGSVWIGTWGGGVDRASRMYNQFNHFRYASAEFEGLSDNNVLSLYQDPQGYVWVGTEGGGLNRLDLDTGRAVVYQNELGETGSISSNSVRSIFPEGNGDLWIGTLGGGLNYFDVDTEQFSQVPFSDETGCFDVYAMERDQETLWVGCSNGLVEYNHAAGEVVAVYNYDPNDDNSLSNGFVTNLLIDPQGVLWVGTFGGLNRMDLESGEITRYLHDRDDPTSISHNNITSMYFDSSGELWVGTLAGGLNKFNAETETFTTYFEYQHQIGDAVVGITEGLEPVSDEGLVLWLSTYQGLVKFSPELGILRVYDQADGLQSNFFNPSSLYRNEGGELLFGGINGFNIFSPGELVSNQVAPDIRITRFFLNLQPVETGAESVLPYSLDYTDTITLSYKEKVISFEFAALSYTAPEKNELNYRLVNFEEEWRQVSGERRFASYTNLDPGEYIFQVIGSNSDGVWNEEGVSLRIVIKPPWWQTWWFETLMVVVVLGGVAAWLRAVERQRDRLELLVEERTQEINESNEKLGVLNQELEAFAYSVSHDLRAPLRALNGYHTILLEEHAEELNEEARDFVARSLNATERMNSMIDAVLELSRMTRHDLDKKRLNLSEIASAHAAELSETAPERKATWKIHPEMEVVADRRVVMVVLENLMGNAWKFTRKCEEPVIEIGELVDEGRKVFFVKDNGVGIDPNRIDLIFTLFQRTHSPDEYEGYGVGLAIVRRAVLKHGGRIWVESEEGAGTVFYFTL